MGATKKHRIQTLGKQLKIYLGEKNAPGGMFRETDPLDTGV